MTGFVVIGSFLAAFGFGAALVMYAAGTGAAVGALVGPRATVVTPIPEAGLGEVTLAGGIRTGVDNFTGSPFLTRVGA